MIDLSARDSAHRAPLRKRFDYGVRGALTSAVVLVLVLVANVGRAARTI